MFADISRGLTHLTKKDVKFIWTPKCKKCFQILKDFLQQALILSGPFKGSLLYWAALTKETYAFYMSIEMLSYYIDTAKITVKNDHLPLKKFLEKNTLNSKVNNWAVELDS